MADGEGGPSAAAIQAGLHEGICAWCRTPLASYPDGLLCPHLFLARGSRQHAGALGALFQSLDVIRVVAYLRVVAESSPGTRRRVTRYEEVRHGGRCTVSIYWRDRIWEFDFAAGQGPWPRSGESFRLTLIVRGKPVEQAEISLPAPDRPHAVTVLRTRLARRQPAGAEA